MELRWNRDASSEPDYMQSLRGWALAMQRRKSKAWQQIVSEETSGCSAVSHKQIILGWETSYTLQISSKSLVLDGARLEYVRCKSTTLKQWWNKRMIRYKSLEDTTPSSHKASCQMLAHKAFRVRRSVPSREQEESYSKNRYNTKTKTEQAELSSYLNSPWNLEHILKAQIWVLVMLMRFGLG